MRLVLLRGSAWSTTKECMDINRGEHDVSVGIEHWLRSGDAQDWN